MRSHSVPGVDTLIFSPTFTHSPSTSSRSYRHRSGTLRGRIHLKTVATGSKYSRNRGSGPVGFRRHRIWCELKTQEGSRRFPLYLSLKNSSPANLEVRWVLLERKILLESISKFLCSSPAFGVPSWESSESRNKLHQSRRKRIVFIPG